MRLSSSRSTAIIHRPQQDFPLWDKAGTRPSLDLQFADRKDLVDATTGSNLVDFTRQSSGTYVGSDGLIKSATTNEPRFDHDPTTGESLGLLVEESRTNLITNSTDVAAYFTEQNSTATANAAASPDGTTTATLLTPNTTSATHTSFSTSISFSANTTYSYSMFVKPNGYTFVQLLFTSGFGNNSAWVNFNLSGAGSIGFSGGGELSKQIQAYPNGWYRCTIIATSGPSIFGGGPAYAVLDSDRNVRDANYPGNNIDGAYLWGAQLEAAAPFPTSYIPTKGSTVTRAADVASISGAAFASFYQQNEGTLFARCQRSAAVGSNTSIASFSDGAVNNNVRLRQDGNGTTVTLIGVTSGTNDGVVQANAGVNGSTAAVAGAAALNDYQLANRGVLGTLDSSALMPTVDRLEIGAVAGIAFYNGTIGRLTYWRQRLPNSTLQAITG